MRQHNAVLFAGILIATGCANDQRGPENQNGSKPTVPFAANKEEPVTDTRRKQQHPNKKLIAEAMVANDATRPASPGYEHYRALPPQPYYMEQGQENYQHFEDNGVHRVVENPVSTFSVDVDTESYANARRMLRNGQLPVANAVRSEEFINYFDYDYPTPDTKGKPFSVTTEIAPTPWNTDSHLLHIGLKGYEVPSSEIPAANLVFLVDVSGSMHSPNKLPLVKKSLELLTRKLRSEDRISIVVYAGNAGTVLEPTAGNEHHTILNALNQLQAGGSTNGQAGIEQAYQLARQQFINDGVNRVIICTDGDFNVGTTSIESLKSLIERERKSGVTLTTLGFGTGNYNGALMEQLADIGNGNAAYIDTLLEANKVLVQEMSSTLFTIASDVKIQLEFSPQVAEYRLIGYENRILKREDFNNDKVDAGDIGAGHTVTALYEIVLASNDKPLTDPLRYAHSKPVRQSERSDKYSDELAFLKLRYKLPGQSKSTAMATPIYHRDIKKDLSQASDRFRWSASASAFGQLLRGSKWLQDFDYQDVAELAQGARQQDPYGYRGEFIQLVNLAQSLSNTYARQEGTSSQVIRTR